MKKYEELMKEIWINMRKYRENLMKKYARNIKKCEENMKGIM